MIFAPTGPLESRRRFKARSFENMAILIAIFVPLVMGISQTVSGVLPVLIGDALCIVFVYYLYCMWNRRPIKVRCDSCRGVLSSNTPWVCGFCKEPNRNANEYPFVYECGHCHDEPKAYRCHHHDCNKLVFLSEDLDER